MRTTRWPFDSMGTEMNRLQQEMNRLFGNCGFELAVAGAFPAANIWVDAESVCIEAELPGVDPADLEIELLGDQQLQLKGQRNQVNVEAVSWHRRERETGQFERTFELPVAVNPDRVSAQFKNGVLLVTLPKREEAKARKVVIKTS